MVVRIGKRIEVRLDDAHREALSLVLESTIISTDTGFDRVPGIRRLDPSLLATWRDEVFVAR